MRWLLTVSALFLVFVFAGTASAHEVRPALLQITERADGRYDFLWKQPVVAELAVHLRPVISGGVLDREPDRIDLRAGFALLAWNNVNAGPRGVDGRVLRIEGLTNTITDVLVSIKTADGGTSQQILGPSHPDMILRLHPAGAAIASYLVLGIEHILTGVDHLSFVLGLLLLVGSRSGLIKAISAFTLAHSLTLAATALHLISIPPPVVETLVALSIVFVAVEVVKSYQGSAGLASRQPWLVALCFGLLHGAAFAGALARVGLPHDAVLPALLLFNLGVEIGQLLFVGAVLLLWAAMRRVPSVPLHRFRWLAPHAIGSFAVFWFVDRLQTALIWGS